MSYLQPPPDMSPVVVVKDFGGYVNEYSAQTELYRRTGREVRIHECHSACTMALGLPNVCVYKNSVFKFHQAYDPRNHVTNWQITDQLYHTYPDAVRDRLGTPTKSFTVMRGIELIGLGVRDCTEPQGPRIIVASASAKPLPDTMTTGTGWTTLTGRLNGMIPNFSSKPDAAEAPTRRVAPAIPADMLVPLPPTKPSALETTDPQPGDIPLPPPRPSDLDTPSATAERAPAEGVRSLSPVPFLRRIAGSQPILPTRFVPFPKSPT